MCLVFALCLFLFFVKPKPAYDMRISDWSSDVCSSDLTSRTAAAAAAASDAWAFRWGWAAPASAGGGIGGLGLIAIVVIALLFGVDPGVLLTEIGRASWRERVCTYV